MYDMFKEVVQLILFIQEVSEVVNNVVNNFLKLLRTKIAK